MYGNIDARLNVVEETSLKGLREAARFAKEMGAYVKMDIMSSPELEFLKALRESGAIREILMDEEVKDVVAKIKKRGG